MIRNSSLHPDMRECLKNINECLIKIAMKDNLDIKLQKLESLKEGEFYEQYPKELFND